MSMMNKCANIFEDTPSGQKVKINLASAFELSGTADFVYSFTSSKSLCKKVKIDQTLKARGPAL